ncbi:MAG: hypothetical protein ACOYIR_03295 [Christensenellales bacterium]|jgi:hypothetical protein
MKNKFVLIIVVLFLLSTGAGLLAMIERPMTVDFGGRSYTLADYSRTFASLTFAFTAEDGSRVDGESDLESGGMVVTYTSAEGENSSVLTGKVIRKDGKLQEESFNPDETKNVGTAISKPEAHRFVLAVARKEGMKDYATKALIYWALSAALMVYGALTLGKQTKRAKWLPTVALLGGSLIVVALFADLFFM